MNRRGLIRSLFATAAVATGLARAKLELVDEPITFKGVPIVFDAPDRDAVYYVSQFGLFRLTGIDAAEGRPARLLAASPDGVTWTRGPGNWNDMEGLDA